MTTTISKDSSVITLINIFTVDPQHQQKLINMLVDATEKTMRHLPGFIAANIHKSLDGKQVVNYAQWRSRKDFEAMLQNPEAIPHMKEIASFTKFEPNLYEVVEVIHT
jgi:heme-degrading monooxygenase HmoA